jgi:hypothetical protein
MSAPACLLVHVHLPSRPIACPPPCSCVACLSARATPARHPMPLPGVPICPCARHPVPLCGLPICLTSRYRTTAVRWPHPRRQRQRRTTTRWPHPHDDERDGATPTAAATRRAARRSRPRRQRQRRYLCRYLRSLMRRRNLLNLQIISGMVSVLITTCMDDWS